MEQEKLKREIKRKALLRLEEAARTQEDFEEIVRLWDHLDANRERKERAHEIGRDAVPLEWGASKEDAYCICASSVAWQQMMRGDLLEMIFDSPEAFQQLVEDADVFEAIQGLSVRHKELLYLHMVRLYTCEEIAAMKGLTDRNIRKVRVSMMKKIRAALSQ